MAARVSNVWLPVQDMDRAVGFYRDVLGLEVKMQSPQWSELDAGGLSVGLNGRETASGSGGGAVISFQAHGDLAAEVEDLKSEGVTFTGGVSSYDWGSVAPFKDTEGNDLQLFAPPAS
ncbi:MAG: VOC family protein [Actinomycetota bacterium]|nr:VOC family protein [Actinomycetota bacterium]